MKITKKLTNLALAAVMMFSISACGRSVETTANDVQEVKTASDNSVENNADEPVEKNGSVMILFTSDVHCGVDQGFGYAGLAQIRRSYENQGYTTILVDDGDSIQGEALGTLTKGEAMIELMNAVKYDAAIPGNHEFDYGTDRFIELSEKAEFPYISCNFNKEGELVFDPYTIIEAEGMRIAFVGVTTPTTIVTSSSSKSFMNESGEYVYGFMQEDNGQALYEAVQNAVDDARAEGVDYVYVLGHMGMEANAGPWTYADVISNTNGIDVFLDGHSHDTEQVVMKNKDGEDVVRSACGTKLNCIGYSLISPDNGIEETNVLIWPNKTTLRKFSGLKMK
ncbi:MAG: metallophosphoesterase [Firmicutes bacterium]|nr:metallophosphoesterase [Bacillota bacterium]